MYAGSGTNYFDLSLEPTQELFVTLVTFYRVCSVTSVTLHTVKWITGPVIGRFLQVKLSVQTYRASYRSTSTGPVIGPDLQYQLSAHVYRANYRSRSTGPVLGPRLQGQLSVHIYRACYRTTSTGPVIGPHLQGQLPVHFFRASYWSNPLSLDIGRFTSNKSQKITNKWEDQ